MIKIVLAEDHQIVRNGVKTLLEKEKDLKVVGEAENGLETLKLLENNPDVDIILADVNMPEMDGLQLAATVRENYPKTKVIILSMLDHEKYVVDAFDQGVKGYLLKNVDNKEMVFAVRHIFEGRPYICSELSMKMFKKVARQIKKPEFSKDESIEFTQRELEVLTLIADGLTNQEIADKLFTSKRTVEGHRQNMIDKTGAKNTPALVQYAFRAGIIS